jgi:hypothetical protein
MQSAHILSFMNAKPRYLKYIGRSAGLVFILLLFSCSSISLNQRDQQQHENVMPLRYSMVFIIHGDGDYLYHDTRGNEHTADEDAFIEATIVAMQNPLAEVFIFREKRREYTLYFFPQPDGELYYYRHGKLLARASYRRDQGPARFDPEIELYQRFQAVQHLQPLKFLLYFGHEIPEFDGLGYDASYPDRTFTVDDLAFGLKRLTPNSTKFDLIALSTCFNGTPHTIAALAPYARTIVASPDNLHLSYFDPQPFEHLDSSLPDTDISAFSKTFARLSFDRLTENIQTAVTVAVYDVDSIQGFLQTVGSVYDHTLMTLKEQKAGSLEHCDCAEDPAYVLSEMRKGVDVFYRPPRFGRLKNKKQHSGWECWRLLK